MRAGPRLNLGIPCDRSGSPTDEPEGLAMPSLHVLKAPTRGRLSLSKARSTSSDATRLRDRHPDHLRSAASTPRSSASGPLLHRGQQKPQRHLRQQPGDFRTDPPCETTTASASSDFIAAYHDQQPLTSPTRSSDEPDGSSTVEATIMQPPSSCWKPSPQKLRVLLDISSTSADTRTGQAAAQDRR